MPVTQRHNPSAAVVKTPVIADYGVAGTDSGTAVVVAPFNCYVSWIGIWADTVADVITNFTLVHSADAGYGTRATPSVVSVGVGARVANAEVSPGVVNNQWQAGEPIVVTSGGETVAGGSAHATMVLTPA